MKIWIILSILGFIVILLSGKKKTPKSKSKPVGTDKLEPEIKISIHTNAPTHFSNPNTGDISAINDGEWILNPKSTFPLTVHGIDQSTARELKRLLEEGFSWGTHALASSIVSIIALSNLHCREIDEYIRKFKPQYLNKIEELKRSSKGWTTASDKDRKDLLVGFRQQAIESLDIRPYCNLEVLFDHEPTDYSIYKRLIDRFGYENTQSYLLNAIDLEKIRVIPADSADERNRFEELVKLGLAIRGMDINPSAILNTLRLQDMNSLLAGLTQPPFARKAKAIEFLITLPDLRERLGKVVAYRELFQLRPLPDDFSCVNLRKLLDIETYAKEIATIIAHTYVMGGYGMSKYEDTDYSSNLTGWELDSVDDKNTYPYCIRAAGKKYPKNRRPKTPLHIGCRCGVIPTMKDSLE